MVVVWLEYPKVCLGIGIRKRVQREGGIFM